MLGKLTKHELNATSRFLLPFYLGFLVLVAVGKLFIWLSSKKSFVDSSPESVSGMVGYSSSVLTGFYILLILITFVISFVYILMRFHKNYFTDEGYLMFTLPVNTKSLLFSKLITAFLWSLLNIVIVLFSLFVILYSKDFNNTFGNFYKVLKDFIAQQGDYIVNKLGISFGGFVTEILIVFIIKILSYYLLFYTSMAIGQTVSKNHRVLGAVLSAVIIMVVLQIISAIVFKIVAGNAPDNAGTAVQITLITTMVYNLILCVIFFFATDHILKNKLDLE